MTSSNTSEELITRRQYSLESDNEHSRRRFLRSASILGLTGLAGRVGDDPEDDDSPADGSQPEEGPLFYVVGDGDVTLYYYGTSTPDLLDITHMTIELGDSVHGVIMFNEYFYPIHWMFDDMTVAVRRTENETFDPTDAAHVTVASCGTLNMIDIELDGVIEDLLEEVLNELADENVQKLLQFRDYAETLDVLHLSFNELVDLARSGHENREQFSVIASVVSVLSIVGDITGAISIPGVPLQDTISQILDALGGLGEREFIGDDTDGPAVDMLKCNGASVVPNLCSQWFIPNIPGNASKCTSCCFTNLRCFTDICKPVTMSVEVALNQRSRY